MKRFDEAVTKIHSHYVADDYTQVMLSYQNYLILFGNGGLMYFKNFIESTPSIIEGSLNIYLEDERKNDFPYSQIPEHIERFLFRKLYFANQILDFEKPYIRITDGFIIKMTAFKDGDEALVHTKILNGKTYGKITTPVTREELETYLKTGSLEQFDENEYEFCCVFDMNGVLYAPLLVPEQELIDEEKERLSKIMYQTYGYKESTKSEIQRAISSLDDIEPVIFDKRTMLKYKQNGEIKIDIFTIKYLQRGKYEIALTNLPVTMESLSMIKSKIELPIIKASQEPKISLLLNPNITKKQLQEEKARILVKENYKKR